MSAIFASTAARPAVPRLHVSTTALAGLGIAALALSGGHAGIEALVWVAPIPWLLWMRRVRGVGGALLVLAAVYLALILQLSTIVSTPVPWVFAPMLAAPMALGAWAVFVVTELLRRATSDRLALYGFAALAALGDVATGAWGPTGVWGTASAGLSDNLVVLQLASLLGVGGIGFLAAWVAAWIATALATGEAKRWLPDGAVLAVALLATVGFGTWRLSQTSDAPTVSVAAVVTDAGLTPQGLPSDAELAASVDTLFARSERAAARGARLVVWNEGATAVRPDQAQALIDRGAAFARSHGVDLVLGYIVVTGLEPLTFLNQATFLSDAGEVLVTYRKRHPVPGETTPSDNPVPRLERPYGVVSLAICYDHDYPEMSRRHAAAGTDLVALPSSDWAGIDPVHTRMARVRAIEGGFSTLRATRWGASAGFDPTGRVRGWMRVDEVNDRVLVTELPVRRVPTVYAAIGDAPMGLVGIFVLGWIGLAGWRRFSPGGRPSRAPARSANARS